MEQSQGLFPAPKDPTLIKHLASCNKSTRDKALRLLKTWLPSQPKIPDEELKKLWKGLFYCVWHADGNVVDFNESVISNLRMQFEKVGAEVGLDKDGSSLLDSPKIAFKRTNPKKRKRVRSFVDGQKSQYPELSCLGDAAAKTNEKSAKRRLDFQSRITWSGNRTAQLMPPQGLRLPPSVTARR